MFRSLFNNSKYSNLLTVILIIAIIGIIIIVGIIGYNIYKKHSIIENDNKINYLKIWLKIILMKTIQVIQI